MSAFTLKIIACIAMVIDHTGEFLFPGTVWMRCVGRFAFPIYCFLLTEGFKHSRDIRNYLMRLLAFAFVSELPYNLIHSGRFICPELQNVFFTLFLGLLMMYLLEWTESAVLRAFIVVSAMIFAETFHFSYRYPGILMIYIFYSLRDFPMLRDLNILAANIRLFDADIQSLGGLALIPVSFYNGKRGPSMKYFFYAFYPVHLMVIWLAMKIAG